MCETVKMGRPRIHAVKEPRDDLNRQGRRIGDGNKKLKYRVVQNDQETGEPLQSHEFATIQQIADYLNISRDSVEYMRRKNANFSRHHNKHLKFIEISKI